MEFYLGVLIFIACMISLALLIYYCQEYRNPKYSFTSNQRDISAIALAIGVPGFQPGEYRTAPHSPGFVPTYTSPQSAAAPPQPGFAVDNIPSAPYPAEGLPPFPVKPPPREYMHELVLPEYMSDDSSTSSEQIYYAPKTAAYSVAKRMSMSANVARRMSAAVYAKETQPSITADVAAFLIAKRMTKNFMNRRTANEVKNKLNDAEDTENNKPDSGNSKILEKTVVILSDPLYKRENEKVQHKSISPQSSETASARSSISRIIDAEESRRKSASPYIPASVVALRLKSRSRSPYTSLKSDTKEQNNGDIKTETSSSDPSPPKRTKKPSLKPVENHPLKYTKNSDLKQTDNSPIPQDANICAAKRSENLPPKYSKRRETVPPKETASDRLPLTSAEISYRSHSPTPLHTVEEEED